MRFLRRLVYGHGSPADQWPIIRFLRRSPGAPCGLRLGGHQHPTNTPSILSTLQEREREGYPCGARPHRRRHDCLALRLTDRPHSAAYCDAIRIRVG